jgi:hypothetical protein
MTGPSNGKSWPGLDEIVDAFETARAVGKRADLGEFLPLRDHPQYLAILCELIRVDLEYSWQDGRPHQLAHYRDRFPELFQFLLSASGIGAPAGSAVQMTIRDKNGNVIDTLTAAA